MDSIVKGRITQTRAIQNQWAYSVASWRLPFLNSAAESTLSFSFPLSLSFSHSLIFTFLSLSHSHFISLSSSASSSSHSPLPSLFLSPFLTLTFTTSLSHPALLPSPSLSLSLSFIPCLLTLGPCHPQWPDESRWSLGERYESQSNAETRWLGSNLPYWRSEGSQTAKFVLSHK